MENLLSGKLFTVPPYQRAYSWTSVQRKALFSDITKLLHHPDPERQHFMATVVCLSVHNSSFVGSSQFNRYDIVDGQQRLTTLIILLKAIAIALNSDGSADLREEAREIEKLMVKGDQRLILLQTNHDNATIFKNYLQDGVKPNKEDLITSSQRNLLSAFDDCEKFVKTFASTKILLPLLLAIKNKLAFIFIALEDPGAVYTVFEVLNSRGLPVNWLDKCKSLLMGIAFEKNEDKETAKEVINQLHQIWGEIYKIIGVDNKYENEIVRFSATLFSKNIIKKRYSEEESFNIFREICDKDSSKVMTITEFILKVAHELVQLSHQPKLEAVASIAHVRLLYVAIALSQLNTEEKAIAFDWWEKISFRAFRLYDADSRSSAGVYTQLACKIFANNLSFPQIIQGIRTIGLSYPIDEAANKIWRGTWYDEDNNSISEATRYFLHKYEEYLTEKAHGTINSQVWETIWNEDVNKTIEHIHTQGGLITEWRGKISSDQDVVDKNVHRLGNLTLLPASQNSRCGQKEFTKKKEIYREQYLRNAY